MNRKPSEIDDREDHLTRKRVDEIGASMEAYRERLDARYRIVVMAVIFIAVVIITVGAFSWKSARANHEALCTLRADLQQRVTSGNKFLEDHPNGIAEFPRAAIELNLRNQQRSVDSLSGLSCPEPSP